MMEFKTLKLQANADALSRLPLEDTVSDVTIPGDTVLQLQRLDQSDSWKRSSNAYLTRRAPGSILDEGSN